MRDQAQPDPSYAQWAIAVAVSALLALPVSAQPAQAKRTELIEHSLALLERHRNEVDTSALEAALNQARGGGKNAKHANIKRKLVAALRLQSARDAYAALTRMPNKSQHEKRALRKARRQLKHLKRRADYAGDHDSQTPKGTPYQRR